MKTEMIVTQSQLSAQQLEIRESGIGASEIAAVCGLSPWASATDIWMRKRTPTRGPLIDGNIDSMPIRIGNALEEPLRLMYERETGLDVVKPDITFRHQEFPFLLATPDGICEAQGHGLEIKNVGARMASAWDEGVPDYVELQCRQNMAVLGLERWDVAALLGGSDFQIFTLHRDQELEQTMIDAAVHFWNEYVLTDTAPPEDDPERKRELLKVLFPGRDGKTCIAPADEILFSALCAKLLRKIAAQQGRRKGAER